MEQIEFEKEIQRVNEANAKYEKQRQKEITKTLKWAEKTFKDFKRQGDRNIFLFFYFSIIINLLNIGS